MKLRFLGSGSSVPNVGNDCPCFLINEKYLVDCGYNVLTALRNADADISKIQYILFTHMHHDHYIGLAGLLFYMLQSRVKSIGDLTIIGPETLPEVLERTFSFLQLDKFFVSQKLPQFKVINDGETIETEDALITAGSVYHPVAGRCYRFYDKSSDKILGLSGDTAYKQTMEQLFKNADTLIHDCTLGAAYPNDNPADRACGHSYLTEAINLCENANIPKLFPVHLNDNSAKECIEKLKSSTKISLLFPSRKEDFII